MRKGMTGEMWEKRPAIIASICREEGKQIFKNFS
jgi:hypothetical protein